jgi:hypothetical protein
MGKFFTELTDAHRSFIAQQKLFFVGSAPHSGRVNLSPKGLDSFRILNTRRVAYLDLTGSGNETAAHLLENGRITLMFCAFDGAPLILRLYGEGRTVLPQDGDWPELRPLFGAFIPGERQITVVSISSVQTSCGFSVPLYSFVGDRTQLTQWAEKKGEAGLAEYWAENNVQSIDGLPTPFSS